MPRERYPRWREDSSRRMERQHDAWVNEPAGRYGRGGFGFDEGFYGAYAERPGYYQSHAERYGGDYGRPQGSGWPEPRHHLSRESLERHRRAYHDREIAREVDMALYDAIGRDADGVAVLADDAVITLRGSLPHPRAVDIAEDVARDTPGVRRVRNALRVRR